MEEVITQLRSEHIVSVLLGVAGIVFLGVALAGKCDIRGTQIELKGIPRVLAGLIGILLVVPAIATALDRQIDPDTEVKTIASSGCVLPLQPVSRGEPLNIGNQWLFLGATTISENPQFGNFYLIGGTQRKPKQFTYYADTGKGFTVGGRKFFLKATELHDAWAKIEIYEDQKKCQ